MRSQTLKAWNIISAVKIIPGIGKEITGFDRSCGRLPMCQDEIESLGLKEPLDRKKVVDYMRQFKIMPYWRECEGLGGLGFRPHIGWKAGQRFQEILHLYSKEEVERLSAKLRSPTVPRDRPDKDR